MADYNALSAEERDLIDWQVERNVRSEEFQRGFGRGSELYAITKETFVNNQRAFFAEPENLQRLQKNEAERQRNGVSDDMQRALEQFQNGGPAAGGSAATLPVPQRDRLVEIK
jgi:hypothetical protein